MLLISTREVQSDGRILMANSVRRIDCVMVSALHCDQAEVHSAYLMETTSQSRATAALHILLPRKPLPPHTMSFFFAAAAAPGAAIS